MCYSQAGLLLPLFYFNMIFCCVHFETLNRNQKKLKDLPAYVTVVVVVVFVVRVVVVCAGLVNADIWFLSKSLSDQKECWKFRAAGPTTPKKTVPEKIETLHPVFSLLKEISLKKQQTVKLDSETYCVKVCVTAPCLQRSENYTKTAKQIEPFFLFTLCSNSYFTTKH